MPTPKKPVLRALSDAHLRAIGMVAASWADLELILLWCLSHVSKVEFKTTLILAGSQNAAAWCEMLQKITHPPKAKGKPKTRQPIDDITDEILSLQRERNNIVHTAWFESNNNSESLSLVQPQERPKASLKVQGAGIPKRGQKIVLESAYTSRDMRKVADQIHQIQAKLIRWKNQLDKPNKLAQLLTANTIPGGKAK